MAGLHLLNRFYHGRITVFHFNHNIRPQNQVMEDAVREFAEKLRLPFVTLKREPKIDVSEKGLREDRFMAYKSLKADLVLCQHLDDAVESYIMNMTKGCPEYTPIPTQTMFEGTRLGIYRPFIRARKSEFESYALNQNIAQYVVEDESNQDTSYRRNYIRHEVVPMFDGMGLPKVVLKKFYINN